MKCDNHHLLDIAGEIGFEGRKNDENRTWRGKICILRSWKNERKCCCHAGIKLSFQFGASNFLFICPIIFIIILFLSFSFFIIALAVSSTVFSFSRSRCSFSYFHSLARVAVSSIFILSLQLGMYVDSSSFSFSFISSC